MGTLGCINDMMQRDKENRELRKVGKKRMSETHGRLLGLTGKRRSSDISPEKLEQIQKYGLRGNKRVIFEES